jgi:hypothetical protein
MGFNLLVYFSSLTFLQKGLHGCGISMAINLAHAGFGQKLIDQINSSGMPSEERPVFLAAWCEEIANELRTNRSGFLGRCCPHLAQSIPADFPDVELISFYLTPVTSQQRRSKEKAIVVSRGAPDVVHLARFAEDNFLWGDFYGILKNFSGSVFPGLALYELIQAAHAIDLGLQPKPITMMGEVHGLRQPSGSNVGYAPEVRTSLLVDQALVDKIDNGLVGKLNTVRTAGMVGQWTKNRLPRLRIWLPLAVVSFVSPEKVGPEQLATNLDDCTSCIYHICFENVIMVLWAAEEQLLSAAQCRGKVISLIVRILFSLRQM